MIHTLSKILIICLMSLCAMTAFAKDEVEIEIEIKDHVFYPAEVEAPAESNIKLIVHNRDDTIEEFESFDLKREKIVPPNGKINIILAPLAPGRYEFFGDFNQDTAKGAIIIKAK